MHGRTQRHVCTHIEARMHMYRQTDKHTHTYTYTHTTHRHTETPTHTHNTHTYNTLAYLYLAFPLAWCWLIDRHLDSFFKVGDHDGTKSTELCMHLLLRVNCNLCVCLCVYARVCMRTAHACMCTYVHAHMET